jgi:hypothetical protein
MASAQKRIAEIIKDQQINIGQFQTGTVLQ